MKDEDKKACLKEAYFHRSKQLLKERCPEEHKQAIEAILKHRQPMSLSWMSTIL